MPIDPPHGLVLLREIQCPWCGKLFCICRSCWRGQRYCSDACRQAARRKAHRQAQQRYRRTERGKNAHRAAEKRRWVGLSRKTQQILDDAGSTPPVGRRTLRCAGLSQPGTWGTLEGVRIGRCHWCGCWGVIVDRFPRRGYGGRTLNTLRAPWRGRLRS